MTNTEMLARCRTFLDEASAGFYTDTEVYTALTEAQLEVITTLALNWWTKTKQAIADTIPVAIKPLVASAGAGVLVGVNSINISDLIVPVSLGWNPADNTSEYPKYRPTIWITESEIDLLTTNTLLKDGYYSWVVPAGIKVYPPAGAGGGNYALTYIQKPANSISGANQPTIALIAHDAVCERALWILMKDREVNQANGHLQLYSQLLKGLMQ